MERIIFSDEKKNCTCNRIVSNNQAQKCRNGKEELPQMKGNVQSNEEYRIGWKFPLIREKCYLNQ
jgi:hypothetical protein